MQSFCKLFVMKFYGAWLFNTKTQRAQRHKESPANKGRMTPAFFVPLCPLCLCVEQPLLQSRHELVSDAVDGLDVLRPSGIGFQLGAEAGDMVVHSSSDRIRLGAPHFIQQFVAADDLAGAVDKQPEDG